MQKINTVETELILLLPSFLAVQPMHHHAFCCWAQKALGASFSMGFDGHPRIAWLSGLAGSLDGGPLDRNPALALPVPELSLVFKDGSWL